MQSKITHPKSTAISKCSKPIKFMTPVKKPYDNLDFFTCDVNDVTNLPAHTLYKFEGGKNCKYTQLVTNEDSWYNKNVLHLDDCSNFVYKGPGNRTYNASEIVKNKKYKKDIKNALNETDGAISKFKYFTCNTNGGGYHGNKWDIYRYDDMNDGSYFDMNDNEWYNNSVSHIKNCNDMKFVPQ